mgnify:CR=1 FL=1
MRKSEIENIDEVFEEVGQDERDWKVYSFWYKEGEHVYKEEEPDNFVYRLKKGELIQYKDSKEKGVIYNYVKSGDIFSTYEITSDNINQTASTLAVTHSKVEMIERREFRRVLKTNPELILDMGDYMTDELQERDGTLRKQLNTTRSQRLLDFFLELENTGYRDTKGLHLDREVRSYYTEITKSSNSVITRALQDLKEEGLVEEDEENNEFIVHV